MNSSATQKPLPLSRTLPFDVGTMHFVGIGGIGMSGIAEILHNLGYAVQGSDMAESANTERLRALSVRVLIGHDAAHLKTAKGEDVAAVVISSAVKPGNAEFDAARMRRIPVVRRAEMLAELMRLKTCVAIAGTHGKTTTTSLVAALIDAGGLHPTVINGGIINAYGTNAKLGSGEWMVVEADESDGTFTKLPAAVAVVTNIDPEHLDHYGSFDAIRQAFQTFVENIPFYGFGVLCIDHPEVQALIARVTDRRILSYGASPQADVRGVNLRATPQGQYFDVEFRHAPQGLRHVFLPMHGEHNFKNALAAIAVAKELKIADATILEALAKFGGVKRRFTKTGEAGGITIIDDYGHHPVEITATLKAAREAVGGEARRPSEPSARGRAGGTPLNASPPPAGRGASSREQEARVGGNQRKVIAVVQPHRYTRVRDLFHEFCTCFNDADAVIVTDIYSAGEPPIEGISRDTLVEGLRRAGHKHVVALETQEALAKAVAQVATPGDFVVCLGAGTISKWAYALPKELDAELQRRKKAAS